jgi:hypothetical protein
MGETPSEFYYNSDVAFLHFRLKQDSLDLSAIYKASGIAITKKKPTSKPKVGAMAVS